MSAFLAWLFFKEKKSRYCHPSGVVDGVGGGIVVIIVVVTNFNLDYNFISTEANLIRGVKNCLMPLALSD